MGEANPLPSLFVPIHPRAWKGNSAKFGCGKQSSESSSDQAPYLLDDGLRGRYLVEHSIGSRLQYLVEVPWP